ncbi:MAG: hypothetical protein A2Y94_02045 [Caldithrix sp. RBG_13_44_9]|nr:MAG: hypothetical protein A2Y94_02045 [Caldithrix sp. RBG_13_44_9]
MALFCEHCKREIGKPDRQFMSDLKLYYLICPYCDHLLSESNRNETAKVKATGTHQDAPAKDKK